MSEDAEEPKVDVEALLEKVKASPHPLIQQKLTKLRRKDITNRLFRALLKEITGQLAYKAFEDLETVEDVVETPIGQHNGVTLKTKVALIPILRAGLGMVEAVHELLPESPVHHIGMFRNKESLLPILYFNKLPAEPACDVAVILEPLIATSGTIRAVVDILKNWGAPRIKIISILASKQGLRSLLEEHPDVEITVAGIDETLTEGGMIKPGLGDAGDRQFGTEVNELDAAETDPKAKRQKTD